MTRARIAAISLLLIVAAGARWLLLREEAAERSALPEARADYRLVSFDLTVMNTEGTPRFIVNAPLLESDPEDGSAVITQPDIALFDDGAPAWDIDAATGWVNSEGDELRLDGSVEMTSRDTDPVRIRTESITIFPDRDEAISDRHVVITGPRGHLEGVGMLARLDTRAWELLSHVRARLLPSRPGTP